MSDKPSLLPCPFPNCGEAPQLTETGNAVRCRQHTRWILRDTWNHRPDPALRVALELAKDALNEFKRFIPNYDGAILWHAIVQEKIAAALSASPTTPQYDEAALDRFAEDGKQAWGIIGQEGSQLVD